VLNLGALLGLVQVAGQLTKFVNDLAKSVEETKKEAQKTLGQEVEVEVVLVKDKDGKAKAGIIIDLPGNVEEPLWLLANSFGLKIRKIEVK